MCQLESVIWTSQLFGNTGVMLWPERGNGAVQSMSHSLLPSDFFFLYPLRFGCLSPLPHSHLNLLLRGRPPKIYSPVFGTVEVHSQEKPWGTPNCSFSFKEIEAQREKYFFNENNICWESIIYMSLTCVLACHPQSNCELGITLLFFRQGTGTLGG